MPRDLQQLMGDLTRVELAVKLAVGESIHATQRRAVELSSGTTSSAELAAMDHPFATRHGSPQMPEVPINRQSGEFVSSWETDGPYDAGGGIGAELRNVSPHAEFLEHGTRVMFARDLMSELEPFAERVLEKEIDKAFRSIFR